MSHICSVPNELLMRLCKCGGTDNEAVVLGGWSRAGLVSKNSTSVRFSYCLSPCAFPHVTLVPRALGEVRKSPGSPWMLSLFD